MTNRVPRDVTQAEVVRALVRAGGTELARRGKGSHRAIRMPGMPRTVIVPSRLDTAMLRGIIRQAGLTVEEFNRLL